MNKYEIAENEYLKEFPNEENPFNWQIQVKLEEIYKFVINRNGRIVGIQEDFDSLDYGKLIYL